MALSSARGRRVKTDTHRLYEIVVPADAHSGAQHQLARQWRGFIHRRILSRYDWQTLRLVGGEVAHPNVWCCKVGLSVRPCSCPCCSHLGCPRGRLQQTGGSGRRAMDGGRVSTSTGSSSTCVSTQQFNHKTQSGLIIACELSGVQKASIKTINRDSMDIVDVLA